MPSLQWSFLLIVILVILGVMASMPFLQILGALFLIILVMVAVGSAVFVSKAMNLQKSANTYLEQSLPVILKNWNADEFIRHAETVFFPDERRRLELDQFFSGLSTLGNLQNFRVSECGVEASSSQGTLAKFTLNAWFDRGPAQINIVLIRDGARWRYMRFDIAIPAPLDRATENVRVTDSSYSERPGGRLLDRSG